MLFGRNYDWITGNGMICTNQKGLSKISMNTNDGETISWVSQYGSITFNQYGKEFPTGGMNEKGLVVELMWLDDTQYPVPDSRPAIEVLQWIQYQLDNCSTVDELIETDKKLRIASKGTAPLHYLVADAKGNVATIEFLKGKMVVHKGNDLPFPVLTNHSYASGLSLAKVAVSAPSADYLTFTDNSVERFAKACYMVKEFQQSNITVPVVDYSFSILDKVAQGAHTKWSIVYDISNKKIYFKTYGYPEIKNISCTALNFDCSFPSKTWDINQHVSGSVDGLLTDFTADFNRKIVEKSFDDSESQISVSKDEKRKTWEYPGSISCFTSPTNKQN